MIGRQELYANWVTKKPGSVRLFSTIIYIKNQVFTEKLF